MMVDALDGALASSVALHAERLDSLAAPIRDETQCAGICRSSRTYG